MWFSFSVTVIPLNYDSNQQITKIPALCDISFFLKKFSQFSGWKLSLVRNDSV